MKKSFQTNNSIHIPDKDEHIFRIPNILPNTTKNEFGRMYDSDHISGELSSTHQKSSLLLKVVEPSKWDNPVTVMHSNSDLKRFLPRTTSVSPNRFSQKKLVLDKVLSESREQLMSKSPANQLNKVDIQLKINEAVTSPKPNSIRAKLQNWDGEALQLRRNPSPRLNNQSGQKGKNPNSKNPSPQQLEHQDSLKQKRKFIIQK